MIRTHVLPCNLPKEQADALNRASAEIYNGIVVRHWRIFRKKGIWLSEKSGTRLSDYHTDVSLHAHTIDAAQQGFYKACKVTRTLKKIDPQSKYPHRCRKFRTTIWKNTAIKRDSDCLILSNGRTNPKITIAIPESLQECLRILETRLVFDKVSGRYTWHIVAEDGKQPALCPGDNTVSVDMGEIHPAVVGDETESHIITCRELRHQKQGHAKRFAKISKAIARKKKGSIRHKKLIRAKSRMKAKHARVVRDMEHKISREIVKVAVELKASTIVIGDVRDIADGVNLGKRTNQKISGWAHGKVRTFTEYKAAAEGIGIKLQDEAYSTQTCPNCGHRHKPRGRVYRCPACRFQSHRDVVGQVNILSAYKYGKPGQIPTPTVIKHRIPHNLRVMRRCLDTGQTAKSVASSNEREAHRL